MDTQFGLLTLIVAIALCLLPGVVTILIGCNVSCSNRRTILFQLSTTIVSCFLNFSIFVLLHKVLFGYWNFFRTAKSIKTFSFTYQDIDLLPTTLLLCLIFAIILGIVLRIIILRIPGIKDRQTKPAKIKKPLFFLTIALLGSAIIGIYFYGFTGINNIVINEIAGNIAEKVIDQKGTVCDYIELYNKGDLDCVLHGLYLTDDEGNLQKKKVPTCTIPAKGYIVIKMDNSTMAIRGKGNETITLSDSYGNILDQVITQSVGKDYSYSRNIDGNSQWSERFATPGSANADGEEKLRLTFSHNGGFYKDAFDLTINGTDGATIYYTLDGSVPTAEDLVYSKPIHIYDKSAEPNVYRNIKNVVTGWQDTYSPNETPVDKAFVVRAVAISPEGNISDIVTATYFINLDQYAQMNVVALSVEPEEMWGENGIYVTGAAYDAWYTGGKKGSAPEPNFSLRGREYEIESSFEYFSQNQSLNQSVGLRISGGSSRNRALKAFSLYARNEYSDNRVFDISLAGGVANHKLALRGGYANSICQTLVEDRAVATQGYTRTAVFVNGEFWYNTNILEKYDAQYFESHYNVSRDNIVVIKQNVVEEGLEEDSLLRKEIYSFLSQHDMSEQENYQAFGEIVDLQSYIDYMCTNIYIDNMDYTEAKNTVIWRSRTKEDSFYADGKWRFCLYDLDAMEWNDASLWGLASSAEKNSFRLTPRYTGGMAINQQPIFVALKQNPEFCKQFVLSFMDLVNTNFQYENVKNIIDAYGRDVTNYHSGNGGTPQLSYYDAFFKNRANYIVPYMAEEFGLTGTKETLTLQINEESAGYIVLNTITPQFTDGKWSGEYYTDYPVTVTAVANPGYRFVGWTEDVCANTETMEVNLTEGGLKLRAVFEKITPA